ncbi:MAG: biotin/lipoyl-binding protein [Planctomycetota bacterium]|nr:biotin/lipoyl-binding protein [Planctomycetota bacterium]
MASGPSDENVENTKRHIRTLVNEITELSKSDAKSAEYYPAVLQRIISALAAAGGAIWLVDGDGNMRLAHQIQMDSSLMQANNQEAMMHGRLLTRLFTQGRAELIPPMSGTGDESGEGNPTRYLLVTAPLVSNKQPVGLLEVMQRPDSPAEAQRGYLRFLEHMTKLMGDWIQGNALQQVSNRQEMWQQSDQFARLVHDNLDLNDTAYTIANEGRRLIECDRVSVAMLKGGKLKVIAISGQDSIENRSNIVQSLNALATKVVRSGEPLWYDGSMVDLPPQIEEAVEDYVDLSHGRTITVLPIRQPERKIEGDVLAARSETSETRTRRDIIGALIVEQIETQLSRQTLEGRVDLVYEHSCRALSNSLSHSQILFMPVWRFLDKMTWMFRGSALPKTAAILGAIGVALLAMFIVPVDFDLEGNGKFKPSVEKNVYAHVDGEVAGVFVKHGQDVEAGQPLLKLKNPELEQQIKSIEGEIDTQTARMNNAGAARQNPNMTTAEKNKNYQEYEESKTTIEAKRALLKLYEEKNRKLVRTSEISGRISTWDVEKVLNARPVVTGQLLMTVFDPKADWEIEVLMPEKRMRYLDLGMTEALKNGKEYLEVDFILMTDPKVRHKAKVYPDGISQRAELDTEDGAVVKIRCKPDSEAMEKIKRYPEARVIADIKCGKESAAFVWFHEVVEWVRANVWF